MIRLTDPEGDPILMQEHYVICVLPYQTEKAGPVPTWPIAPKSMVVLPEGKVFLVMEDVEEIDFIIRTGMSPGGGATEKVT